VGRVHEREERADEPVGGDVVAEDAIGLAAFGQLSDQDLPPHVAATHGCRVEFRSGGRCDP
jgi:hypothetical protein